MSNVQLQDLQRCLGEARRTLSERKTGWEKVLQHQKDRGASEDELAVKEEEFHDRIKVMTRIVEVLEMAVMGAQEAGSGAQLISFQGEVMLSNWSETASAGRKVEFWLPEGADAPDEHPFKYYTRRLRGSPGTRFQMVLVEIGDDDRPLPRGTGEARPRIAQGGRLVGGAISKHAGRLCKDSDFHRHLQEAGFLETDEGDPNELEQQAKEYIYSVTGVDSRALLDHNRDAQLAYENQIVTPFNHWLERQGGVQ